MKRKTLEVEFGGVSVGDEEGEAEGQADLFEAAGKKSRKS